MPPYRAIGGPGGIRSSKERSDELGSLTPAEGEENALPKKSKAKAQPEDARVVGALLRSLRRGAGYRAVQDAADRPPCPAARQTIYAYERGGLAPSLEQFLDLVAFYAERPVDGAKTNDDLRAQAVAAIARALSLKTYHVREAHDLMDRLQPDARPSRRRK